MLGKLTHHFFTTKAGEYLSYYQDGDVVNDKPRVLLIHGNATRAMDWEEVVLQWQDTYHLLVPDLRGYGDSSYHNPATTLQEIAADLMELVEALEWKDFAVIGWSLGGGVAVEFCRFVPERVTKLILTAAMGMVGYPMPAIDQEGIHFDRPLKTKEEVANSAYYLPTALALDRQDEATLRAGIAGLFHRTTPSEKVIQRILDSEYQQRNLLDMDYALLIYNSTDAPNLSGFEGTGHLHDLKVPILLLHGKEDTVVSYKLAEQNQELFGETSKLVLFEDCGHALHLENPEKWFEETERFLAEN